MIIHHIPSVCGWYPTYPHHSREPKDRPTASTAPRLKITVEPAQQVQIEGEDVGMSVEGVASYVETCWNMLKLWFSLTFGSNCSALNLAVKYVWSMLKVTWCMPSAASSIRKRSSWSLTELRKHHGTEFVRSTSKKMWDSLSYLEALDISISDS